MVKAKDKSLIVVILDRSGSMSSIQSDMEGGLNQFIKEQQAVDGKCNFTLAQFDDQYEVVADFIDIQDAKHYALSPRGMTALLDAMGKTIKTVRGQVKALAKKDQPKKIVVCIITDGMENASSEWKHPDVMSLIKECESDGWQFVYLGANQDAVQVGSSIGMAASNSMSYSPTAKGVSSTYSSLSSNVASYRGGVAMDAAFSDEQREEALEQDQS